MNPESSTQNDPGLKLEGGLRTLGLGKEYDEIHPVISVITVVFNGEKELEQTIKSVLDQTYKNVEYIIVDGGSTDNSLEIIRKYDSDIDYWLSEPDKGIYDAMNKGINLARGKWLNFMNSGDMFFSNNIVEKLFSGRDFGSTLIIHGNWEVRYGALRKRIALSGSSGSLWKGSQFCHQAVFINKAYHKAHPFSSDSKIIGDFEFFYTAWKENEIFLKISDVVASIEAGGVSDMKRFEVLKSYQLVIDKDLKSSIYFLYRCSKEFLVFIIKKLIN